MPLSRDVDVEHIAQKTERFSGADLAALLRQAVHFVLKEYRERRKELLKQENNCSAILLKEPQAANPESKIDHIKVDYLPYTFL